MARSVTLFTGQWADLSFDTICQKAKSFGYDGVELACWGDHFNVDQCLKDKNYAKGRWAPSSPMSFNAISIAALSSLFCCSSGDVASECSKAK